VATADRLTVGIRVPHGLLAGDPAGLRRFIDAAEGAGIDRVCVGDHVTFKNGQGFDGLIHATAVAALSRTLTVQTAVYLLPLRHPVAVARQLVTLAPFAPGRLIFGVGVGGEDRAEMWACGVDPSTRGRRMDESLGILRPLLAGERVTNGGEFFPIDDVPIHPTPDIAVPVVIGGRSPKALRRVARHGDGWLALWVSSDRYSRACGQIDDLAAAHGRTDTYWQHGMHVWCGFGSVRRAAREQLAATMQSFYQLPFDTFERYCPYGTPKDIADALQPYVDAGCRSFNLIAGSGDQDEIIQGAVEVRAQLSRETT
jgi:alkanesulfonate monooxygenase SsuD/methylene tetrahydromethanopterin reductase-like flavin-dependent oxidoreductase (luciferase family)